MPEKHRKPGPRKGQPKPLKRVLDERFPRRLLESMGGRDKVPEISRRIGCTRAALSRLLGGRPRQIEALLLFALADDLHVDPRWLATGKGERGGFGLEERQLLAAYREAEDDEKEIIRRLLDRFSGEERK